MIFLKKNKYIPFFLIFTITFIILNNTFVIANASAATSFNNINVNNEPKYITERKIKIKNLMYEYNSEQEASIFGVTHIDDNSKNDWILNGNITLNNYVRYGSINNMILAYLTITSGMSLQKHIFNEGLDHGFGFDHSEGIDVYQLLSQTSGIKDFTKFTIIDYYENDDNKTQIIIKHNNLYENIKLGWYYKKTEFFPGEKFCWSRTNYEIVAWLLTNHGKNKIENVITNKFSIVAPSIKSDKTIQYMKKYNDLYNIEFPQTPFYEDWDSYVQYERLFNGKIVIGNAENLIALPVDLINLFKYILKDRSTIHVMNEWNELSSCINKEKNIMGQTYGLGLVYYEKIGNINGPFIGHDSNLPSKSILLFHVPSNLIFFFHATEIMNYELFEFYLQQLLEIWL